MCEAQAQRVCAATAEMVVEHHADSAQLSDITGISPRVAHLRSGFSLTSLPLTPFSTLLHQTRTRVQIWVLTLDLRLSYPRYRHHPLIQNTNLHQVVLPLGQDQNRMSIPQTLLTHPVNFLFQEDHQLLSNSAVNICKRGRYMMMTTVPSPEHSKPLKRPFRPLFDLQVPLTRGK